jgi:hypothetical protein
LVTKYEYKALMNDDPKELAKEIELHEEDGWEVAGFGSHAAGWGVGETGVFNPRDELRQGDRGS